jgi:hypothetical protein
VLTYANVVASLALFLVLSGGAAYAASQLAKNSVGTKQLKNGAVTQAKISAAAQTALKGATGSKGEVGPKGAQGDRGLEGKEGPEGKPGPDAGPAGGALSGSYPNPSLAAGAVGTASFAAGATAPNAVKLGGEEASAFLPSSDVQRIHFNPSECETSASAGCKATILQMRGETLKATCGNGTVASNEIKIEAEGNEQEIENTNAAFIGTAAGGTPHAGGFGRSGTVVNATGQEEAQIGTIVVAGVDYTITISLQVYSVDLFGEESACQVNGTAVLAT